MGKPEKGVWSNQASKTWQEGYFVGNGELGGTLFGNGQQFTVVVNHHELFLKSNRMTSIPDLSTDLNELRRIIAEDGYKSGINFFEQKALEKGYPGLTMSDLYHPAGILSFHIDGYSNVKDYQYQRALDYERGLATSHFIADQASIETKLFASRQTNSVYITIKADQPINMSFQFESFNQKEIKQTINVLDSTTIVQVGHYDDHSTYTVPLKWMSDSKDVRINSEKISLKKMTELSIVVSVNQDARELLLNTSNHVEERHILEHQSKYNQVSLTLGSVVDGNDSMESIIEEMDQNKKIPNLLYEKFYDASRYFIQAMAGKALPNLQGIWSGDFSPPWSGDYTLDTNVQLAIASLASLGHFDSFEGFFSRMHGYSDDFKENAQKYFGCRGYLVPVHASTTALHVHWNRDWPLIFWTAGAGWLAHFYNEYYEYSLDLTFLKDVAIPFYEQTLLFYEDFLISETNQILIRPSYSAENGMGDNSTMDVAVIKATLGYMKKAYSVIGEDIPGKYENLIEKLPDYMIDSEGVLKEWIDEKKEENHNHRHFSNLYPLFQTKEITEQTPELWNAANKAFDKRLDAWLLSDEGDTSSSHGRMHAAMCAIALERGKDVEVAVNELLLNHAFFPSLASSHYNHSHVFNLDANGSYPKIIHDALLYPEADGSITLFKAVPSWLTKGELKGIRLPNGIKVNRFKWDLSQNDCELSLESDDTMTATVQLQKDYVSTEHQQKWVLQLNQHEPKRLKLLLARSG